jgi:hypothetical protein
MLLAAAVASATLAGAARGDIFSENANHATPSRFGNQGANDGPYGWFGNNGARTYEIYRKFLNAPDGTEPFIQNKPETPVGATVFRQTSGVPWWNGSGLWYGPNGASLPTDRILLISHPHNGDPVAGRSDLPMDIRIGFTERDTAGAMIGNLGGDGRTGHQATIDLFHGPLLSDTYNIYANPDQNNNISDVRGFARSGLRTGAPPGTDPNGDNLDEARANAIPATQTGVVGVGPRAITTRIFNDPANGNQPTFEAGIGGWTGTFVLPSLTQDQGGTATSPQPEPVAFEGGMFELNNLVPVLYLNKGGFDATGAFHQMDVFITVPGDASLDGVVNVSDLGILATNYNRTDSANIGFVLGDFNTDGQIDVSDLGILATNYNDVATLQGDLQAFPALAAAMAEVPEPGAAGLLGLAAAGMLARRRRGGGGA